MRSEDDAVDEEMNRRRTHVDLFLHAIIYDLEEADNVGMAELFHDGDFLFDFEFCGI